jgi:hypothetical protein
MMCPYWYRPSGPTTDPRHGIFDNLQTMQRERWEDGRWRSSVSAAYINMELARPQSIAMLGTLHPWGHFPDLPR